MMSLSHWKWKWSLQWTHDQFFFFWRYMCGLRAILTSKCPKLKCLSRTSLEAGGKTKWWIQGAAIFLHPHPTLLAAVRKIFSRGHYWTKRETTLSLLGQRESLSCVEAEHMANNHTRIDNSDCIFFQIHCDPAAEISVNFLSQSCPSFFLHIC